MPLRHTTNVALLHTYHFVSPKRRFKSNTVSVNIYLKPFKSLSCRFYIRRHFDSCIQVLFKYINRLTSYRTFSLTPNRMKFLLLLITYRAKNSRTAYIEGQKIYFEFRRLNSFSWHLLLAMTSMLWHICMRILNK